MTSNLKSYFFVIVALASIVGSTIAAPYISNFVSVGISSDPSSSLIPEASSSQSVPFRVDHHLRIKEKVGDPVRIEEDINDGERHCEASCKYIEYKPGSEGRAGLAFITDSPIDLSGAKKIHFFLMGEKGGETVKVKIAGKNPQSDDANVTNGPAQETDDLFKEKFALSSDVITLPNDWKRYEVPLDGVDLKNIVAPFGIELLKHQGATKQVVYLKHIVYEEEPVDERFLLIANTTGNATTANNTAVESNNTQGQGSENFQGNNNSTFADTIEADNDSANNSGNEIPTPTASNATAD